MNAKELIQAAKDATGFVNATREAELMTYEDAVLRIANHILATVREDDDEPITEKWLYEIGFQDDRTGTPTIGSLHIRPNNTPTYPAYACIRSLPITVPKTRGQLRKLLEALGVK